MSADKIGSSFKAYAKANLLERKPPWFEAK
jgi:hypothetical protein